MRDPDHALSLVEATVSAVRVPVTLKLRLGWDAHSINAPEIARRAEEAGVQMITVHGRTRCQFYEGRADWQAIRAVREATTVPLVANGDVVSREDAERIRMQSGADAVMIGRGAQGRPWFPGAVAAGRAGDAPPGGVPVAEIVMAHFDAMLTHYGVEKGVRHARKHIGWYLDRFARSHVTSVERARILTETDPVTIERLVAEAIGGSEPDAQTRKVA
jgi:tRNA-dihydrouridine synthase B